MNPVTYRLYEYAYKKQGQVADTITWGLTRRNRFPSEYDCARWLDYENRRHDALLLMRELAQ